MERKDSSNNDDTTAVQSGHVNLLDFHDEFD